MRTILDAAVRLGPRPVLLAAWHRSPPGRAVARRRLHAPLPCPAGPVLPLRAPPAPPELAPGHARRLLRQARAVAPPPGGWHGGYPADAPALGIDPYAHGDIRPVWEASRWAALPLLAQAARLDPTGGHLDRAEALLTDWRGANPAFEGPNWICGQEAALRALHLALALALLEAAPSPAARALLALHGRRIAATRAYARAQDNTHAVSEPAGLLVCGLLTGEGGWIRDGAAGLEEAVLRLVTPCGAFAAASTGYHRLLLDVVAVATWLAARHGGPPPCPEVRARMAAASLWLWRLVDPDTGAMPRIGHQDGSAFADLSRAGPDDARGTVERAARLFAGHGAGLAAGDGGCLWLDLAATATEAGAAPGWAAAPAWRSDGFLGWQEGGARAVLRSGAPRLRFRPGHADLLHLELWDGARPVLRDSGTGAYNPAPGRAWWHAHFTGTAAHNTITFDGQDQMERAGRFLFARWPETGLLADGAGAWARDWRGNRHERRVTASAAGRVTASAAGRRWEVEDRVAGGFRALALRWHLPEQEGWRATPRGAEGPAACIEITADAALTLSVEHGWHSPAYGEVRPARVLVARCAAPVTRLVSRIALAPRDGG